VIYFGNIRWYDCDNTLSITEKPINVIEIW